MNKPFTLSRTVFNELSRQVNDFEKSQQSILDNSSLIPIPERKKYEEKFAQYRQHLTHLLDKAQVIDSNDHSLPWVTIGSVVELENLQSKRINKIMVVFPLANPPDPGKYMQTSFNSPIGQALFLKQPGETIEVTAPGGIFHYEIKSIVLSVP